MRNLYLMLPFVALSVMTKGEPKHGFLEFGGAGNSPKKELTDTSKVSANQFSSGTVSKTPGQKKDSINPVVNNFKKIDLIYSIVPSNLSVVSSDVVISKDVIKTNATNIRNALIGKLSGIYTSQFSGQPGNDGVSLSLRGQSPLVVIDGIPRNLTIFDLEEIESVTVLKDAAATAMLGARGSNGVLSIITKKGTAGKQTVSFTAQSGIQQSIKSLRPLNAYEYGRLYNEALQNDGLAPVYTDADLDAYLNKTDIYGHPNVYWIDNMLKRNSKYNKYTLSFNGGSKTARYFVAMEHQNQGGFFITSKDNKYNTNNDFQTYVIRSNVDVDLNKKLSMGLHLLGRILNGYQPGSGTSSVLNAIATTPQNAYPQFNPDRSLGGTTQFQNNIYGQLVKSGYQLNYKRDVFADFYLKRTLDEILKGLWIKGVLSFNASLSQTHVRNKSFATYQRNVSSTNVITYTKYGSDGTQATGNNGIDYQSRQSYLEFSLGYDRSFGKHGVSALVLATQDKGVNGSDLALTYQGVSGRVNYNFNKKYVADFSFAYNGSNRYPEGTKYGFYPAVGAAWNISEESFINKNKINLLKLYTSLGKTGLDRAGYFTYNQYFYDGPTAYFGTSATGYTSMNEQVLANPNIDYEKALKFNVGLEVAVLNNRLSANLEYYNNKYYDLFQQRGHNTTLIGNDYPDENIGKNNYSGSDLSVEWNDHIKGFNYFVTVNAGLLKTKVVFMDEVTREYDWMVRTGRPVGQTFGYTALGLFQNQAEINSSATVTGYTPKPGDIKYLDMNKDGVINQLDMSPIGNTKPLYTYGAEIGFNVKGFDFSVLLQGVKNKTLTLTGNSEWEFQNNGFGQAFWHHLNRWTPATAATATYPRLSIGNNINNDIVSSYWMHSGNYARIKFAEFGYSFNQGFIRKLKIETIRLFFNGSNLLTFAAYDRVDPEVNGITYPLQRVFNAGLTIKF